MSESSSISLLSPCARDARRSREDFERVLLSWARRPSPCLTAIFPRDDDAEKNLDASEPCCHKRVPPGRRGEEGRSARRHETQTHHRNHLNGECSPGHNPRAVEEEPQAGQQPGCSGTINHDRQQGARRDPPAVKEGATTGQAAGCLGKENPGPSPGGRRGGKGRG